ncbi:penicillin acylase family protein [Gordonia sp. HNM0687]|uniref:Penicillin acylase family protein n=1 Tax=Gordonia mangrovi TaxID=2665643 RepID=A0A6L7GTE1_9ACTN|nr:penicillin acylase family protein [Gordonia mangrovi]MXP21778.1 penicillin acylase family protein [Gordonia mangrovi]UVF80504.1 penicillin acylase family protein [Gordonia mangrovi]
MNPTAHSDPQPLTADRSDPRQDEYCVSDLTDDVEILVDTWGIPHVYATTRMDAFVAQGFHAARDRLFQIDLWRRRGLGLLAEVLGPEYVSQDRATRLFLYRGDMRSEWLSYSTDAEETVSAFVAGVNAYVSWALQDPERRLPPEFGALGFLPAYWRPEDVVRIRTHGLLYNVEQELARALTLRDLGAPGEEFRSVREPAGELDDADVSLYAHLRDEVLDVYREAFAPVDFGTATASEVSTPSGSNNWVIAPWLSASGRPVMANDPHRAVTLPALRYLAHLEAPGLSVIGAGEPNLPGISIGHNGRVAFGLTIWPVDHEDMYIYELHPTDDSRYRYRGGWEKFEVVEESSPVAGEADVVHQLSYTRHGPVVYTDLDARRVVAIRAVWLEPGMAPYLASLEYQDAADADEFRRALRRWGAPGVNMVYASKDGDIGWQASALVPRRVGWDGSRPVPGDGTFEWDGFASVDELPSAVNPESGWFTTSNQNNVPDVHDSVALPTTVDWYSSARHERLRAWFTSGAPLDVESSINMQSNADNVHGRRLLEALSGVATPEGFATEWRELQEWDGTESIDSRAALIFQVWQRRHFRPWLVDTCFQRLGVPAENAAAGRHRLLRADTLFSDIRPDLRMVASFDQNDDGDLQLLGKGVAETLPSALAEIADLLGPDRDRWQWGALHRTTLRHAVLSKTPNTPSEWGELAPVPRSGSGDTVGLTGYDAEFNAVMGSSFRIAVDVGEWDSSLVLNSPGQSGDPRSDHYADLLPAWQSDTAFQLAYSREAVESVVARRIVLRSAASDEAPTR